MDKKIIPIEKYRKFNNKSFVKNYKMLFFTIIIGALIGSLMWKFYVENIANLDVEIPPSQNITFNEKQPIGLTTSQIAEQFERAEGKPILLYIYTTWCKICSKNFPQINEVAREFQNTKLQFIPIAIDRNMDPNYLSQYLDRFGSLYFPPNYLLSKSGFIDFLQKHQIKYNGRIPFTVLISGNGEIVTKFSGKKRGNYLRNKIIKELAL